MVVTPTAYLTKDDQTLRTPNLVMNAKWSIPHPSHSSTCAIFATENEMNDWILHKHVSAPMKLDDGWPESVES